MGWWLGEGGEGWQCGGHVQKTPDRQPENSYDMLSIYRFPLLMSLKVKS